MVHIIRDVIKISVLVVFMYGVAAELCPNSCTCSDGNIDCGSQQLTEVPRHLPANTTLFNLSNNAITVLLDNQFAGMLELQSLYLDNNELEHIEATSFLGLSNLVTLHLQHNRIHYILSSFFIGTPSLRELNIQDNLLRNLPPLTFLSNASVDLTVNPWTCDCHMTDYKEWLETIPESTKTSFDLSCQNPTRLSGQSLDHVDSRSLVCPAPPVFSDKFNLIVVVEGENAEIECGLDGGHIDEIIWILPDKSLMVDGTYRDNVLLLNHGRTLVIVRAEQQLNGVYVCIAQNGTQQRTFVHGVNVTSDNDDTSGGSRVVIKEVCRSHETSSYIGVFLGGFLLAVAFAACAYPIFRYCRSRVRKTLEFRDSSNRPPYVCENNGVNLQDFHAGEQGI